MKRMLMVIGLMCVGSAGFSQNLIVGGMYGLGSNVSETEQVDKQDLKFREIFAGMFSEETTLLQIRAGRMEPRKAEPTQLDLKYVSFTVSYLFDTPLGQQGFFAGPSYYTGDLVYPDPLQPDQPSVRESVSKLGAMGGVEGYFALTQTFSIYGQISGHYIPVQNRQLTFEAGLGLAIRF